MRKYGPSQNRMLSKFIILYQKLIIWDNIFTNLYGKDKLKEFYKIEYINH